MCTFHVVRATPLEFLVDDLIEPEHHLGFNALRHASPTREESELNREYEELIIRAKERAKERARMGSRTTLGDLRIVTRNDGVQDSVLSLVQEHKMGHATWVRMRRVNTKLRNYVGDIALAISTAQPNEFEFWLVPRPPLVKQCKGVRPMQMMFNAALAVAEFGEDSVTFFTGPIIKFGFREDRYSGEGFLVIRGPPTFAASFGGQALPTAQEFDLFNSCEGLTAKMQRETKLRIAQNDIIIGDRVKCIGELQGLTGLVQDVSDDTVTIHLPSMNLIETVMRYEVRKEFRIGDQVLITVGTQQDKLGWIVAVEDPTIVVFDPKDDVEVSFKNCFT